MRGFLVMALIAVCFVLLAADGLLVRSLFEAERADLGFRPEGILNIHMDVGQVGYSEARGRAFFEEVERSVRTTPNARPERPWRPEAKSRRTRASTVP